MSKVSFVIPYFNHWELTHQALFGLYQFCRADIDEVVAVNDGSTDVEAHTGISWWKQNKMLPIRILEMEENVGFLRASNAGIRRASGDIIVLMSNDVVIQENISVKIKNQVRDMHPCLIGGKLYEGDTGWNKFRSKIFPYLEGWLLAASREVWDGLGMGFDERFAPNDYEDIDLSTTARNKNVALVSLEGSKITHLSGRSLGYSPEREALTLKNKSKFEEKWIHARTGKH